MMKKPNAILHMTSYGAIYGAICGLLLAMFYIWLFFLLYGGNFLELSEILGGIVWTAYISLISGALPGAIMGFIEGWILWFMTWRIDLPIQQGDLKDTRNLALGVIGGLTFIGMSLVMIFRFNGFALVLLLSFIAAGAAMYAVHRYILKLYAWGNIGKQKNKAKHSLKHQLTDDNPDENIEFSNYESDAQEMKR